MGANDPSNNPGNEPVVPQPDPTPAPVTPPAVPNPGTSTDWEASYKGLQGTYNKLHGEHTQLQQKYDALNVDHQKTLQELQKAQADLLAANNGLTEKEKLVLEKQSTAEKTASSLERLKLIAKKYPDLTSMELEGLIPEVPADQLETKLQALQQSMNAIIDQKTKQSVLNVPPKSSTPTLLEPNPLTQEELSTKLMALAGSKDPKDVAEYERLFALMIELNQKPG